MYQKMRRPSPPPLSLSLGPLQPSRTSTNFTPAVGHLPPAAHRLPVQRHQVPHGQPHPRRLPIRRLHIREEHRRLRQVATLQPAPRYPCRAAQLGRSRPSCHGICCHPGMAMLLFSQSITRSGTNMKILGPYLYHSQYEISVDI